MESTELILQLPQLSRTEVDLRNTIANHAGLSLRIADHDWQVQLQALPQYHVPALVVKCLVDGQACDIGVNQQWLQSLMTSYLDDAALAELPPELAAAVLEAMLEPLLDQAEQALGVSIVLQSIEPTEITMTDAIEIGFHVWADDKQSCGGQLSVTENVAAVLNATLAKQAHKPPLDWYALPITLAVVLGTTELDLATLHDLEQSDFIIMEQGAWLSESAVTLRCSPVLAYRASLENSQITLQALETTVNEESTPANDKAPALTDLADMPVTISFELDELTLPLREVQALQLGHTFTLATTPAHAVRVCANGRTIGIGELVQVGEHLGVRLVQLYTQSDD